MEVIMAEGESSVSSKIFIAVESLETKTSSFLLQVGALDSATGELVHIPFSPAESLMRRSREFLYNRLRYRYIHRTTTGVEAEFLKEDGILAETLSESDGMLRLLRFLQRAARYSSSSQIVLVFYSIIEHQSLFNMAKNLAYEGESSLLDAISKVVNTTVIYEQNLENSDCRLEPLNKLLHIRGKVYSSHKVAMLFLQLFRTRKLDVELMKSTAIDQTFYKSLKVDENKYLVVSSCQTSTEPSASFQDSSSDPITVSKIRLQEEVRLGIKRLVFMSIEGVTTVSDSQMTQIGCCSSILLFSGRNNTTKCAVNLLLKESIKRTLMELPHRSPSLGKVLLNDSNKKENIVRLKLKEKNKYACEKLAIYLKQLRKHNSDLSLVLVFYSSVEYAAFSSLRDPNSALDAIEDIVSSVVIMEEADKRSSLPPLIINEKFSDFWGTEKRTCISAVAVKELFEDYVQSDSNVSWNSFNEKSLRFSYHHGYFRSCFVNHSTAKSSPNFFTTCFPDVDTGPPTDKSKLFEQNNKKLSAQDPNVGMCVHKSGLFGFAQPVLVDLGKINPDTKSIVYEANLEEYSGKGHVNVIKGSKNFAFVILKPRKTIQNYQLHSYALKIVYILEPGTPLVSFAQSTERVQNSVQTDEAVNLHIPELKELVDAILHKELCPEEQECTETVPNPSLGEQNGGLNNLIQQVQVQPVQPESTQTPAEPEAVQFPLQTSETENDHSQPQLEIIQTLQQVQTDAVDNTVQASAGTETVEDPTQTEIVKDQVQALHTETVQSPAVHPELTDTDNSPVQPSLMQNRNSIEKESTDSEQSSILQIDTNTVQDLAQSPVQQMETDTLQEELTEPAQSTVKLMETNNIQKTVQNENAHNPSQREQMKTEESEEIRPLYITTLRHRDQTEVRFKPPASVMVDIQLSPGQAITNFSTQDVFVFEKKSAACLNRYMTIIRPGSRACARIVYGGGRGAGGGGGGDDFIYLSTDISCGFVHPVGDHLDEDDLDLKSQEIGLSKLPNVKVVVGYHPREKKVELTKNGNRVAAMEIKLEIPPEKIKEEV